MEDSSSTGTIDVSYLKPNDSNVVTADALSMEDFEQANKNNHSLKCHLVRQHSKGKKLASHMINTEDSSYGTLWVTSPNCVQHLELNLSKR